MQQVSLLCLAKSRHNENSTALVLQNAIQKGTRQVILARDPQMAGDLE